MADPMYKHVGDIEDRVVEECAELIKEISKARRFGYENHHPKDLSKTTNRQRIRNEIRDVLDTLDEYVEYL